MKPEFVCTYEQYLTAQEILSEAKEFGVRADDLDIKVGEIPHSRSVFDPPFFGLEEVRSILRMRVLEGHGAVIDENLRKTQEEVFHRGDSFSFLVWKSWGGNVIAQGDLVYMAGTPIVQKLFSLRSTGREWERVVCWNLGDPQYILDEDSKHFKRIIPEAGVFLFKDELKKLKADGSILTQNSHSLYEEGFEAYLAEKGHYGWPTLYKINAYLLD